MTVSQVEGMLIYPPGKFGAKHLRMLTLIHGGPRRRGRQSLQGGLVLLGGNSGRSRLAGF